MTEAKEPTAWEILQAPFDVDSISLLPRYIGKKEDKGKDKRRCAECGTTHDFPAIHLSYVGHADITMRLNEADPTWTWEPMAYDEQGLPALDAQGGLWAWLTINGVRKPAYGDPGLAWDGKSKAGTPDGMKEAIGDMLRNGAMRFGAGTQLWSKSDKAKQMLVDADDTPSDTPKPAAKSGGITPKQAGYLVGKAKEYGYTRDDLTVTAKRKYGLAPDESGKYDLVGLTKAQMDELLAAMKAHPRTQGDEEIADKMDEVAAEIVGEDAGYADDEIPF